MTIGLRAEHMRRISQGRARRSEKQENLVVSLPKKPRSNRNSSNASNASPTWACQSIQFNRHVT
jgi:hypothetical protein